MLFSILNYKLQLFKCAEYNHTRGFRTPAPSPCLFRLFFQKPVAVLKKLIEIFTDEGDIVIDPCCGSGSALRAAMELNRSSYGFEINKDFYKRAKEEMLNLNWINSKMKNQISGQMSIDDLMADKVL